MRIHYNYPDESHQDCKRFPYNDKLDYGISEFSKEDNSCSEYVAALYDEEFYGNYIPDDKIEGERVLLCGSLTPNGYYNCSQEADGAVLDFFIIYPEKTSRSSQESLKFATGMIITNKEKEIYARGLDTGLALLTGNKLKYINWQIGQGQGTNDRIDYHYESNEENCKVNPSNSCEMLIIPKSDINFEPGKTISNNTDYIISLNITNHLAEVYSKGSENVNKIGKLKSTSTVFSVCKEPTELKRYSHFLKGNLYDNIEFDEGYITLFREATTGKFRYYFSNKYGEETSNPDLKSYCNNQNNCKMENLNLFPNIKTYIKSTLTSADIGDQSSKRDLLMEVIDYLADDHNKRSQISREIAGNEKFQAAVKYRLNIDTNFQEAVASNTDLQEGVAAKLREDPRNAKGPQGKPGDSPSADAVAVQLMKNDNRNTLVTEVAVNLKGDKDFKEAVKGEDANPLEIVNRLKHDGRFKREVRSKVSEKDVKQIVDELITEKKKKNLDKWYLMHLMVVVTILRLRSLIKLLSIHRTL